MAPIEDGQDIFPQPIVRKKDTPYSVEIDPSIEGIPPEALNFFTHIYRNLEKSIRENPRRHEEHLSKSKKEILKTASIALARAPKDKPRRAIILGAGNCLDIPLKELARNRRLDEITLVDIDRESVEKATQSLRKRHQRKIKIVIADITGTAAQVTSAAQAIAQESTFQFTQRMEEFFATTDLRRRIPNLGSDYTFVCSQLLTSQLFASQLAFIDNILASKSRRLFVPGIRERVSAETKNRIDLLQEHIQVDHIRLLAQLISYLGTLHLADTYSSEEDRDSRQDLLPLVATEAVERNIDEYFTHITPDQEWTWNHPYYLFKIISKSLQAKRTE